MSAQVDATQKSVEPLFVRDHTGRGEAGEGPERVRRYTVSGLCQGVGVTDVNPSPDEPQLAELTRLMREFAEDRDWTKFHDPKSLALALMGEVGELAELLQWVPADAAVEHFQEPGRKHRVGEEISDVLFYLLRLADVLGVDVMSAARAKHAAARQRYPAEHVHGTAPERA